MEKPKLILSSTAVAVSKTKHDVGAWGLIGCITLIVLGSLLATAAAYLFIAYVALHFVNKWW